MNYARIENSILSIRGLRVLLDEDLAALYEVETKALKRQVRRNLDRFPEDFMFELTREELADLRSRIGASSRWGGTRHLPFAFTEQGVAMLSSVLNSERAIRVNIAIMRAFVRMREVLATHAELLKRLEAIESRTDQHDERLAAVFEAIHQLMNSPSERDASADRIGFHPNRPKSLRR